MKTATDIAEPWRSDKRWRDGRIKDRLGSNIFFSVLFTVIWNTIAVLAVHAVWVERPRQNALVGVTLVLLAIGLLLLIWTLRLVAMRLKYGRSVLELETMPGVVGGYLAGTIRTGHIVDAREGLRLKLQCVNRVTSGSGKQRNTFEHVRWEDEQLLSGALPGGGGATSIPVCFAIPEDAPETRDLNRNDILWRLGARAVTEGPDYVANFVVPVYRTDVTTSVPKAEAVAAKLRKAGPPPAQRASDAGIRYSKDAAGRVQFEFPAARNKRAAALVTFMALLFLGVGVGMAFAGEWFLWIFTIVFGLFGLGMLVAAWVMWFKSRTVTVRADDVEVRWQALVMSGATTIPRDAVAGVRYRINSQFGDTPYLEVLIQCEGRPDVKVAGGLKMADAKWVAGELAAALGTTAHGEMSSELDE